MEFLDIFRVGFQNDTLVFTHNTHGDRSYRDEDFADLFPKCGQPALTPWRLALVTVMQYVENLSDRQAAEAVRARIDWKYALSLELTNQGFDYSVLSEFRKRLVETDAAQRLLDLMLVQFRTAGLLKARGRQRTDSTAVLSRVKALTRLELVGETLRTALNAIAVRAPDWLRDQVDSSWFERYGTRVEEYRLPDNEVERRTLGETIAVDGYQLMTAISDPTAPSSLSELAAVQTLHHIWLQNFVVIEGKVSWRQSGNLPPAHDKVISPFDTEERYGRKRTNTWAGYSVHITETCDDVGPHLINPCRNGSCDTD